MFDLALYVPYLLNRVGVRLALAFSDQLAQFDLTLPMWRVMAALWNDGDGQRVGSLVQSTSIEQSTLSRMLSGMEAQGLLERLRCGSDARAVRVSLTPKGRALAERLIPKALELETSALEGLKPSEVEVLRTTLNRIFDNAGRLTAAKGR